jgi:hypothetical protein
MRDLQQKFMCWPNRMILFGAAVFAAVSLLPAGRAQETVRMSLAGEEAERARREAATTEGYYNLKLGLTEWRLSAGLGVEFNDNVNLSEGHREGDVIFRPQINTQMRWPVTDKNSLNLTLGVGYSAYVNHPELDQVFLAPGTELSFDVYVGDFWINLHDRVSITQNAYQDPTVSGTGDYARLENALGVSALWDLNKVIVRAGYDHVLYDSLLGHGQNDGQSDLFTTSAGYVIQPGSVAGVELGAGLIQYDMNPVSNADQWNAGAFYDTQVSEYLRFHGSLGYTAYRPGSSSTGTNASNFDGYYLQLNLTHRISQYVDYSLSAGRNISFTFYGGTVDLYYVYLQGIWRVMEKVIITTPLSFEHGKELNTGGETFDRYGAGISLSRELTRKLSGSLTYQYYWRSSDVPNQSYNMNSVSLNLTYAF